MSRSSSTVAIRPLSTGLAAFVDQHLAGMDDEPMARFANELSAGTLVVSESSGG